MFASRFLTRSHSLLLGCFSFLLELNLMFLLDLDSLGNGISCKLLTSKVQKKMVGGRGLIFLGGC